MQRVLRRTALAKSQAKRKLRIREDKEAIRDKYIYLHLKEFVDRQTSNAVRAARKTRRENWELGSLSPWKDGAHNDGTYGAFDAKIITPAIKPKKMRVKDWFFKEGDRVCVVRGREGLKGRIGKIDQINIEGETVTLKGVNMIYLRVPEAMRDRAGLIQSADAPIPLSNVQLVYPLPDPITGIPRDTILTNLVKGDVYFDIYKNEKVWSRYLEPQHLRIPWPEKEEEEFVDNEVDTLRLQVEQGTFMPTLLRPPMPMGVINELRNKFSKFRDRHEPMWVARMEEKDANAAWWKEKSDAMVPYGTRARGKMDAAPDGKSTLSRTPPQLSNSILEALGAHMAAKGQILPKHDLPPT